MVQCSLIVVYVVQRHSDSCPRFPSFGAGPSAVVAAVTAPYPGARSRARHGPRCFFQDTTFRRLSAGVVDTNNVGHYEGISAGMRSEANMPIFQLFVNKGAKRKQSDTTLVRDERGMKHKLKPC